MISSSLPAHIRFLLNSFESTVSINSPSLLQTHISWILLTGHYAYKLKKPVDFGFLDFTTLEKRRQACQDELRLNRRLAPDIYLDVLPIYKSNDGYSLEPRSTRQEIVDYCLKMKRFDQNDLFDRRVGNNAFDPGWMDQLAQTIATFHQQTQADPYTERFGAPEYLERHISESLTTGEEHLKERMPETIKETSHSRYQSSVQALKRRQQLHRIRDCHGDLHLKNIVLYNNRPTPFDCIEFNDEFRIIDTMNDVAFLVMDCDSRGRSDLGYRFLSRYLEQCGDYEGLSLLPLYLSYRAGVRGKVGCLLADDASLSQHEKQLQLDEATDYFRLAEKYLTPPSAKLIAIGGLSGSGKSHLALLGLNHEKAIIIRTDATRKRIAADHPDLPLYGKQMHELTYRSMFDAARLALEAGFTAILDATFLHPASRAEAASLARVKNVPLAFLWIDARPEILRERIVTRSHLYNDISDADLYVLEKQLEEYARPQEPFITFIDDSDHWPL